jgi:hypothetical protein
MKLQSEIDYIVIKKGGYFDGRRTLQQMGNLVVTKNCMIVNVMLTTDAMKTHYENSGTFKGTSAWTPIGRLKNSVSDLKVASKDMKTSMTVAKESYKTMKDMGVSAGILEGIANESETLSEFESRAAAMGEDNPKSLYFLLKEVKSFSVGFLGTIKINLINENTIKMFAISNKKRVKNFLAKCVIGS